MSEISYFQTYSQRENVVTNNCLLALKHFYEVDPAKLDAVLDTICNKDIPLGIEFTQQVHTGKSIPDGFIGQEPFRIYIETKLHESLDENQIRRHAEGIKQYVERDGGRGSCYLLGLVKEDAASEDAHIEQLKTICSECKVEFIKTTFDQLLKAMRGATKESDVKLMQVANDFEVYLGNEDLLPPRGMVSFPVGYTMEANCKTGVYYNPHAIGEVLFMGLYDDKVIQWIGKIEKGGRNLTYDGATPEQKQRIEKCTEGESDDLRRSFYFQLVEEIPGGGYFYETKLKKVSRGGQWGRRYLYEVRDVNIAEYDDAKDLAEALRGKEYK